MEMAAETVNELGRTRLAKLLREEVVRRREQGEGTRQTYELVKEWVQSVPDVTLPQIEIALAEENGVTVPELRQRLRRLEKVFREAKSDVLEARRMKAKLMKSAIRGRPLVLDFRRLASQRPRQRIFLPGRLSPPIAGQQLL